MIYIYNPRTQKLYFPYSNIVVNNIRNYAAAKAVVAEYKDPANLLFVVKTKTGKNYYFADKMAAIEFAKAKSSKRSAYIVYTNAKAITAFMNGKPLTEWKTVYTVTHRIPDTKTIYSKLQEELVPGFEKAHYQAYVKETLDVAENKVRLCGHYIQYTCVGEGKFYKRSFKDSIVFHKNGQVYRHNNGQIIHELYQKNNLCLFSCVLITKLREALSELRPELKTVLAFAEKHDLCLCFNRPTAVFKFDTYHQKHTKRRDSVYYKYYPREIVDESKIVDIVAKNMNTPITKNLRKIYMQNILNIEVVRFLSDVGFKDVNSYYKLVGLGVYFEKCDPSEHKPFFSRLIALRGENNAVKMLEDTRLDIIWDTSVNYSSIDSAVTDYILKNARNIEEIHDTFNVSRRKERKDEKIVYSAEEIAKYNLECDDQITFSLADGSMDLAVIGANMGICVGGYAHIALSKCTTIIKMMQGDKYIACIEVTRDTLVQLKAKFNNPLPAEYKVYVDQWLQHCKVRYENCCDYQDIGKPWNRVYNYAVINPAEFERHDTLRVVKAEHKHYDINNEWYKDNDSDYNRTIYEDDDFYEDDDLPL